MFGSDLYQREARELLQAIRDAANALNAGDAMAAIAILERAQRASAKYQADRFTQTTDVLAEAMKGILK